MGKVKVLIKNEQKDVKIPTGIRLLIRRCCNAALQLDVQGFHLMPTYENHYLQYVYFG